MGLPNYFLVDLPPEASLTATMVTEACRTLRQNREHYLASRSTQSLVSMLCHLAEDWLKPGFSFRSLALEQGPAALGFSQQTLEVGLDTFFRQWTPAGFSALIEQDLGHFERLDRLVAINPEQKTNRLSIANGPAIIVHVAAGNLPCPAILTMALGLLTRSAQFVKCASGTGLLPRLFAHSLYNAEPKLAACVEIAEWKGGDQALESALFAEADCVTATGSDEALENIRRRLPAKTRFVGYGHRVSFAYIAADAFSRGNLSRVVERAAADVTAWDQLGCLSPHVIYVQNGGIVTGERFAEMLADTLALREQVEPRGELRVEAAAAIAALRSAYELRASDSKETKLWCSKGSTAWTVVYEADPRFQLSCLNRFIYVKSAKNLSEVLHSAEEVRGKTSSVGLAAPAHQTENLALQLARWGVSRVCPLGQMQNPPLAWRHDGRPALGELVTWTDWEQ